MSSVGVTRRGFLVRAGALSAAPLAVGAWPDEAAEARAKTCARTTPGVRRMGLALAPGLLWATDTDAGTISAFEARDLSHARTIEVGDAPHAIAANDRLALV